MSASRGPYDRVSDLEELGRRPSSAQQAHLRRHRTRIDRCLLIVTYPCDATFAVGHAPRELRTHS
jgi:hypothetical protein